MLKNERQKLIIDIVAASPVSKQEVIVDLLRKNGFAVTQASVSRDLDELGISKLNGVYRLQTARKTTSAFGPVGIVSAGESLIVAKCGPGLASALAVKIDSMALGEIIGTIAGDDTVFIAVNGSSEQTRIVKTLLEELEIGG